jgi:hypothetical protein
VFRHITNSRNTLQRDSEMGYTFPYLQIRLFAKQGGASMENSTAVAEKPATNLVDRAGSPDIARNTMNPLADDHEYDDPSFLYDWIMPT